MAELKNTVEKIVSAKKKQIELLSELVEIEKYEKCKYHIVQNNRPISQYILIRLKDNAFVSFGSIERIKSYLNIRAISKDLVYNYNKYIK